MKQEHLEENLYDFVFKRMKGKDYQQAEEHLKQCEKCRLAVEELKATLATIGQFQAPSLPADFKDKVMQEIRRIHQPSLQPDSVFQKIKNWFRVPYIRIPVEGLATAAIVLLVLIVYRGLAPERQPMPKEIKILPIPPEVKNPILIETENPDIAFVRLFQFISSNQGKIIMSMSIDSGFAVVLKIEKSKEEYLFKWLKTTGRMRMEKEGYKDKDGNIVVILKRR